MSEASDRYRVVADAFGERVRSVPDDRWDAPAPCEGWVARDVVVHLVEWVPGFFSATKAGVAFPDGPSAHDDPAGAWAAFDAAVRDALADPAVATKSYDGHTGPTTFEQDLAMFVTPDVLVHTWDLARATGLDEQLDADAVHDLLLEMESIDDGPMRESGHFGPRVPVADDADEQTRLLAFTGRHP